MDKIVCFGEILVDMLAQPPATPESPRAFLQYAGGAPANVAVAVARLGGRSHFVGMLGRDMFGEFLSECLIDEGVATDGVVWTDRAKTALAFVALDDTGERSFSFYRPPAADLLFRADDFQAASFEDPGYFHVCSNSLTEAAIAEATYAGMQRARDAGAVVSMDLNLRAVLWPGDVDPMPWLWRALELADLVKLAREELEYLASPYDADGEAAVLKRLFDAHARCVVITDGAAPIRWYTPQEQGRVTGYRVDAVDTTGAGDAFVGGLLHALAQRNAGAAGFAHFCADASAITQSLRFGAAVGALSVTRKGAFAAMPTLSEVQRLQQSVQENFA